MPGPLGTLGPTVDPNWAWNTPAWTTQGNTGDTEGTNLGAPGQASMLVEPAALSGYIARTLDPDVTTAGGTGTTLTFVTGTAFLFAMQVLEPVTTTGVVVAGKTAGPPTHSVAGLYNATTGTQVAVTADLLTAGFGTAAAKIPWATATAISPGYYWALLVESGGTMGTLTAFTLTAEAQLLLTSTHPIPFVTGTTLRFATGGTGLTGLTATPAGLTTLGPLLATNVVSATATQSFVALY